MKLIFSFTSFWGIVEILKWRLWNIVESYTDDYDTINCGWLNSCSMRSVINRHKYVSGLRTVDNLCIYLQQLYIHSDYEEEFITYVHMSTFMQCFLYLLIWWRCVIFKLAKSLTFPASTAPSNFLSSTFLDLVGLISRMHGQSSMHDELFMWVYGMSVHYWVSPTISTALLVNISTWPEFMVLCILLLLVVSTITIVIYDLSMMENLTQKTKKTPEIFIGFETIIKITQLNLKTSLGTPCISAKITHGWRIICCYSTPLYEVNAFDLNLLIRSSYTQTAEISWFHFPANIFWWHASQAFLYASLLTQYILCVY